MKQREQEAREYVKLMLEIWNGDRGSAFWAIFDSYAMIIGSQEWESAVDALPEHIQRLVNSYGCTGCLDFEYWGSPSFFGSTFDKEYMSQEEQESLEVFYEKDEDSYLRFLTAVDEMLWEETQKQTEYFEAFKVVLEL